MPPAHLSVANMTASSATIEWEQPDDNGGAPITHYILEKRNTGQTEWETLTTLPSSSTECELENMASAKDYYIRVRAQNKYGVSEPKDIAEPIRVKGVQKGILLTTYICKHSHKQSSIKNKACRYIEIEKQQD